MIKTVPIPLASGKTAWLHAGPTREMPEGYKLIRCAAEIDTPAYKVAFDIATEDFSTFNLDRLTFCLPRILEDLEDGERLYVGCMGGTGRTGTILAILVAQHPAFTSEMAIAYIRQVYKSGAVETKRQEDQVHDFEGIAFASKPSGVEVLKAHGFYADPEPDKPPFWHRLWSRLIPG